MQTFGILFEYPYIVESVVGFRSDFRLTPKGRTADAKID